MTVEFFMCKQKQWREEYEYYYWLIFIHLKYGDMNIRLILYSYSQNIAKLVDAPNSLFVDFINTEEICYWCLTTCVSWN